VGGDIDENVQNFDRYQESIWEGENFNTKGI